MSLARLKKQSKNLARLLPEHIKKHPNGGPLSACQELIARADGFPSWHTATTRPGSVQTDPDALSQRIFDDLKHIHNQTAAHEGDVWAWRTEGLINAVLDLQLFLEARGQTLDAETLYDFHALESVCEKWRFVPGPRTHTLEEYFAILPAYEAPSVRGGRPAEETTVEHHGFNAMAIKSMRLKNDPIQHKPFRRTYPKPHISD